MFNRVVEINKCIYCDGIGSTDEHAIPFALGGTMLLKNASCEECRVITSKFERNPLKDNWAVARAVLDYPSRRRDYDSETYPFDVVLKDGTETTLQLQRSEVVGLAPFMEYTLPGFFQPEGYTHGIRLSGHRVVAFGPNYMNLVEKYGIRTLHYKVEHKGNDFERMVAKVAYSFTVGIIGLDAFKDRLVLPAILNTRDEIGFWMGCDFEARIVPPIGKIQAANVIRLATLKKAGDPERYIVATVKFFAASDAPEYIVVIGTLKPDFVLSTKEAVSG